MPQKINCKVFGQCMTRDVLFEYHRAVVHFFEQLDQLKVCLPYSRLLAGIPILVVFQNLRWNSNKTSLVFLASRIYIAVKKELVLAVF